MDRESYEICRTYIGSIDSVSTEATTLIQSTKAYNADQQGSAKLYIHADGGRDTATLLSQEETNKTMALILETYAANIKSSRNKLIEIINNEYTAILEEIERLKV
jgi:hypothetical protein